MQASATFPHRRSDLIEKLIPDPIRHFGASDNHSGFCRWFFVFHRRAHRSAQIKKSIKNLLSINCSEHPTTYSTPLSRPCRPFWSRLAIILDFTGAALQMVSECLGYPRFFIWGVQDSCTFPKSGKAKKICSDRKTCLT